MDTFLILIGVASVILAAGIASGCVMNGIPPLVHIQKNYYNPTPQEAHPEEFEP